jgi:dGTPase
MNTRGISVQFAELMPYAVTDQNSKGRKTDEDFHSGDFRTAFQHDRDRLIHSRAFRRLEAKTQVVLIHESDHSRTRLTHSLEVGQISESIAISLGLNTFATLAIALGHDVGHTPFGHTGEKALNKILSDFGLNGFKHNYQGVLVVNKLEKRYKKNDGLNLMWETRDGILKHSSLKRDIDLNYHDSELDDEVEWPLTLEGQIVRLVDEIAQRTHDTDDGLRTNRINIRELVKQEIVKETIAANKLDSKDLIEGFTKDQNLIISTLIVSMIKYYVLKTIKNAKKNITKHNIKTYDDVINSMDLIIDWDDQFKAKDEAFVKGFLKPRFYDHYEIKRMDSRAEFFLNQIFKAFHNHPKQLPKFTHDLFINSVKSYLSNYTNTGEKDFSKEIRDFLNSSDLKCSDTCSYIPKSKYPNDSQIKNAFCPLMKYNKGACEGIRVIINHIAGMTDRYAHLEYSRLYFPPEISRM